MINEDEDALICDFAETYHVFDYAQLPPAMSARLAVGLPRDSRIKMKLRGEVRDEKTLLLASIFDAVNILVWSKTKDGEKNRNRPKSIVARLYGKERQKPSNLHAVESGEDFKALRNKIIQGSK